MKILIVHPSLSSGGAEKIIAFISNVLTKKYDVSLLLLKNEMVSLPIDKKIKIITKNCYSSQPIFGKYIFSGIKKINNMKYEIKKCIEIENPNLIICFDLRVLLTLSFLGKRILTKTLFSERADPYENPIYWQLILKKIYKSVRYIVFQTSGARDFYSYELRNKSRIIYNPALNRNLNASCKVIEKSDSNKIIFSAGRLQYRKGYDLLIKAFSTVNELKKDYKLVIYGEGEEKDNLLSLVKKLNLSKKVIFKSPVPNVIEKNRNSELFVLPSRSEGIPNILIEAMYEGIPAITTDCSPGGARLLSDDGKYCLIANNNDYNSIAEKIIFAINNTQYMVNMALKAKKSLTRFDEKKIAKEWEDVVKKLL